MFRVTLPVLLVLSVAVGLLLTGTGFDPIGSHTEYCEDCGSTREVVQRHFYFVPRTTLQVHEQAYAGFLGRIGIAHAHAWQPFPTSFDCLLGEGGPSIVRTVGAEEMADQIGKFRGRTDWWTEETTEFFLAASSLDPVNVLTLSFLVAGARGGEYRRLPMRRKVEGCIEGWRATGRLPQRFTGLLPDGVGVRDWEAMRQTCPPWAPGRALRDSDPLAIPR